MVCGVFLKICPPNADSRDCFEMTQIVLDSSLE